ncbi:GmrSD restriction endonuclease domain-containing protein [Micromonospora chokoriensis]|uniref:Uncharacterized conserved protein, contains ParB-like and HNH nuclease domains n=1 Tax=Micromonospora chokoriensis TaxID=356851 RepID=A0A1C4XNI5_9ACTN|nr:DUF262 domain-containing protein [Micromonospora chokoriensis]SCF10037.1 Uncharacterized conserved protein, contains ParB-like and HNH nuclease domains [Micromonospora chokoriensis]
MNVVGIDGRGYSVRELFGKRYGLEHYQREYSWERSHTQELLSDLSRRFLAEWRPNHDRSAILGYRPYFLGSFVCYPSGAVRNLVDGQQRFTTLHLLLILMQRLLVDQGEADTATMVGQLVSTYAVGRREYTIDVPERHACLEALRNGQSFEATAGTPVSVRNLWDRAQDLTEDFPNDLRDDALPFFADWLLDRVFMVEISAYDRDHGWEIFETMNDRGARLTPLDLLKSFLLSNAQEGQADLNSEWRDMLTRLSVFGAQVPNDFFKVLLRSRYAEVDSGDADHIDQAFHEWVRENRERIGLRRGEDFRAFVNQVVAPLARRHEELLMASARYTPDLGAVFFNAMNGVSAQLPLIMAAIHPSDTNELFLAKASLISSYLDLLYIRRAVNNMSVQAQDFFDEADRLLPAVRRSSTVGELRELLGREAAAIEPDFSAIPSFALQDNRRQVRYLLARLTSYVESSSGRPNEVARYLGSVDGVPWEVEHIWANKFERHQSADVPNERQFQRWRNNIGGLLLLSKSDNASFGADKYDVKLEFYRQRNLLAASLHALCYRRNPSFVQFLKTAGLESQFVSYATGFDVSAIKQRAHLYRALCERVWDIEKLGFRPPSVVIPPQRRRSRASYKVTLAQLIQHGFVSRGSRIVGTSKGSRYEAQIVRDGRIALEDGRVFDSLSNAGSSVLGRQSCNGWTFWYIEASGGWVPLAQIRRVAMEKGILE